MSRATCFSKDELRSYLLGALPDRQLDAVAFHVENCVDCETTVSLLDRESDTLIESLRQPIAEESPASAYRLAAQRVKSYWNRSPPEPATVAPDFEGELPKLRDYELLQPIARGGMGTVYRARHVRLNRQVALKVLPSRLLKNPTVVTRFQREMQAVGSLQHPAIVQATDGGEANGVHFLVMELIDGFDGGRLVGLLGPLPVPDACEIVRQAALGMAYVHDQGIIHRDLKPSNLMLTRSGDVKVLDLGLARVVGEQLSGDELTTVGQLMGTLDFMAPEQLENSHEVDERTDIYALGATLYKLLTGCSPHSSDSAEPILSKLRRIATESPTPLQQRLPETTDLLSELVDQMLRQAPAERPQSMRAVADSIESHCQGSDLVKRASEAKKASSKQQDGEPATSPWNPDSHYRPATGQPLATSSVGRRWFLRGAVASLLLAVIAMGVVITLQTTSGQLVIETASPDVEVRILKAGEPYRDLILEQQAETLRLGAGEYEIEIISNSDGLLIENGSYTLRRGETWLARIIHQPSATAAKTFNNRDAAVDRGQREPSSDAPTFESKTLAQWLELLRRERSPKQVYEACRALKKLASGEEADETIDAVLVATRVHDATAFYQSDTQQHIIWRTVQDLLKGMDQQKVLAALSHELQRTDQVSRQFVLNYLMSYEPTALPKISDELIGQVEQLATESPSNLRISALLALRVIAPAQEAAASLVTALSARELEVQLFAADSLIEMQSNLPEVVSALRPIVRSGSLAQRAEAAWHLGDVGPDAAPALPDLTACLEEKSHELTTRGVYGVLQSVGGSRATYVQVSVKDATVRAMAEIGDPSVAPALVAEWERRAYAEEKPQTRAPAWDQRGQRMRSLSENIDWVADSIEQLLGMRPKTERSPKDGIPVTVWYIGSADIGRVYRYGFSSYPGSSAEEIYSFAKKLMPRSHGFQREEIHRFIARVDRIPTAEQLDLEVKLLDLLAEYEDPRVVMQAMLDRWNFYAQFDEVQFDGVDRAVTLETYCDSAAELILRQQDWQATLVPGLLELVDNNSVPAGIVAAKLLNELDPSLQTKSVVNLLALITNFGLQNLTEPKQTIDAWLGSDANRQALYEQIDRLGNIPRQKVMAGMFRTGLDDDVLRQQLVDQFAKDPLNHASFIGWLNLALDDRPELADLTIELMLNPALDESVDPGGGTATSMRAMVLENLGTVPKNHRKRFKPMLEELAKSGKEGEPQAASKVLASWK
jgi:serine/threonine protein kinase